MNQYNEIIEMELLNGIDRAFHRIISDSSQEFGGSFGSGYKRCKALAEELKSILPNYIDKQCDLIGRKSEYVDFLKQIKADNPDADIHIPD